MWHDLDGIVDPPNKCHIIKYENNAAYISFDIEGIVVNYWFDILKEEFEHSPNITFNKEKLLEHISDIERELNENF